MEEPPSQQQQQQIEKEASPWEALLRHRHVQGVVNKTQQILTGAAEYEFNAEEKRERHKVRWLRRTYNFFGLLVIVAILVLLTKFDMHMLLYRLVMPYDDLVESAALSLWITAPFVRNSPYGKRLVGPPYANVTDYHLKADPCLLDNVAEHYVFQNGSVFYLTTVDTDNDAEPDQRAYIELGWMVNAMQQLARQSKFDESILCTYMFGGWPGKVPSFCYTTATIVSTTDKLFLALKVGESSKSFESAVVKDDFFVSTREIEYIASVPKMVTFSYYIINASSTTTMRQSQDIAGKKLLREYSQAELHHVDRLSFNIGVNYLLTEAMRLYRLLVQ